MKLNIVFHSIHAHGYQMAQAISEGAKEVAGVDVGIYRVKETLSDEILDQLKAKEDLASFAHLPEATLDTLKEADGIILGAPTYFGAPSAQMYTYLNSAGEEWVEGKLVGKIGGAFTTSAEQNGGAETCLTHLHTFFMHHGMIVVSVPTPLTLSEMHTTDKPVGGYPYGASMITGGLDDLMLTPEEKKVALLQGRTVAKALREICLGRSM
jgi:NAD(P)H dehydrogenase (quinone)